MTNCRLVTDLRKGIHFHHDIVLIKSRHQNINPKSTGLFSPGAALGGVFSTPLCKIRSRHSRKLKLTRLIAYVMFYTISKFESSTVLNDVIMTSLPKTMGKFGMLH